ncbi:rhamnan synthesis F family protein [Prochlorococcus marinus]|uniref:rhamnan synthesis F family protein n=1 Tax=Prochlorococcus TaxID=1218 RepID=UPI0007BB1554|nr:rhamnan synthesis F family protein [Prochlorococcus marinus]KZR78341.1 Rhamnan synthesis protein F [Prochlorococcus marinus str. MIT 1323]
MTSSYSLRGLLNTGAGRKLKPLLRWAYTRLICNERVLTRAGMIIRSGVRTHDSTKETVLVVSHEASKTGAPILALNLAQNLSDTHNVVVMLLEGGELQEDFKKNATTVISTRNNFINCTVVRRALKRIDQSKKIRFAIVNSVVSAPLIEPLRNEGIACLCLVHEFVTYIKPLDIFSEISIWASRIICSTPLTWNDIVRNCSHLNDVQAIILPQGRCTPPKQVKQKKANNKKSEDISSKDPATDFFKKLAKDTLLVMGAGAIQPRKGVDLFIATAQQIHKQASDLNVKFAWIGSGYDPNHDFNVSVWIKDQIDRSGLSERIVILDASPAYSKLISRSNIFLVSSRLDPLPNVAIDAILESTPVLCFDEACGFATLLEKHPSLHEVCVAPYFDCNSLATKATALLRSQEMATKISEQLKKLAQQWFHMPTYVQQIIELGNTASKEVEKEDADIKIILDSKVINRGFHSTSEKLTDLALTQRYVFAWKNNIHKRKPFPGFHPGIYLESQQPAIQQHDPLAHWIENGKPKGPWQVPLIEASSTVEKLPSNNQVALHIHVFYPELLIQLIQQLQCNTLQPDLFISYSNSELKPAIENVLSQYRQAANMHQVPNRGRDIGPLISEFGRELDRNYLIHGHLHTKKSALIDQRVASRWRDFLLMNLLGNARSPMLDRIASRFQTDSNLGMVFPDDPGCLGWTANRAEAERLAFALGITNLPEAINFPVGTMFWARQGALQPLYKLGLNWNDYPNEPLGYDGTMLHAIERLLPQICMKQGFKYAMTHVPGLTR